MCWTTNKIPKLEIADKDISVFKIVTPKLEAFFHRGFQYEIGVLSVSTLVKPIFKAIDKGLHSYSSNLIITNDNFSNYYRCRAIRIWLSDSYFIEYPDDPDLTIKMDCIIPKGSTYYLNEYGEYISNYLKPLKTYVLDNKKTSN